MPLRKNAPVGTMSKFSSSRRGSGAGLRSARQRRAWAEKADACDRGRVAGEHLATIDSRHGPAVVRSAMRVDRAA
jgi:hypothetical protein